MPRLEVLFKLNSALLRTLGRYRLFWQIEKNAGVSPLLETSADMELFGLLLGRAIPDLM
ncbi:MAG: hypothetical protein LC641_05975 [Spirochaeta sp.]|nr:hypothetical protein [Spirochaeta sp.]